MPQLQRANDTHLGGMLSKLDWIGKQLWKLRDVAHIKHVITLANITDLTGTKLTLAVQHLFIEWQSSLRIWQRVLSKLDSAGWTRAYKAMAACLCSKPLGTWRLPHTVGLQTFGQMIEGVCLYATGPE